MQTIPHPHKSTSHRARFLAALAVPLLIAGACSSDATDDTSTTTTASTVAPSTTGQAATPTTAPAAPTTGQAATPTTVAAAPTTALSQTGAAQLLADFGRAWGNGDWPFMESISSAAVVTTAQSVYADGGMMEAAEPPDCSVFGSETMCGVLYLDGTETSALIFNVHIGDNQSGSALIITDLVATGDAG